MSGPPVVLIVEDEPLVLEIASEEFEDVGCRVIRAIDEVSALAALKSTEHFDLLFTDIRIPGILDGWAIAVLARQDRPTLPIIYATGFSSEQPQLVPGGRLFKKPYSMGAILEAARGFGLAI